MKNVSETSHATVQGHVSTSLNMLRLANYTLQYKHNSNVD